MDPTVVLAISELLKLGVSFLISNARQAGLTEKQIEEAFVEAKTRLLMCDPNKIPEN